MRIVFWQTKSLTPSSPLSTSCASQQCSWQPLRTFACSRTLSMHPISWWSSFCSLHSSVGISSQMCSSSHFSVNQTSWFICHDLFRSFDMSTVLANRHPERRYQTKYYHFIPVLRATFLDFECSFYYSLLWVVSGFLGTYLVNMECLTISNNFWITTYCKLWDPRVTRLLYLRTE